MTDEQFYKVSLAGGSIKIDQMQIDADTAGRIMRLLMPLSIESQVPFATPVARGEDAADLQQISAKDFMVQKQPRSDMERIACLAYYLTQNKGVAQFKTVDLTHLNTEAAQPKLSNASATSRNAVNQQYLALATGGKKQITARGEALVIALPDRRAVQEALKEHPLRGNKKSAPRKSKKAAKVKAT